MAVWQEKFISPNKFSRPQIKLTGVKKLVIHWTANYGATAENHYNYFKNLKDRYASAHIFVDKTEALCIIPLNEVAYHANDGSYRGVSALKPNANYLSIGVELCVEKDGTFHKDTIARAVKVFAELCKKYKLDSDDIVRHYDITHKNCPAPWVSNSKAFEDFKKKVKAELAPKATTTTKPSTSTKITGDTYTVKKDDTLWGISQDTGISVADLKSFNGLKSDELSIGQKLSLKKKTTTTTAKKETEIGSVVIETAMLNIRKSADLEAKIVGTCVKGAKFPVYEEKNGMLRIGTDKWISANADYSKYTKKSTATYYTVKKDDTVSEIAEKYKTTIDKIKSWNKLDSKYTIAIGQKLRVK